MPYYTYLEYQLNTHLSFRKQLTHIYTSSLQTSLDPSTSLSRSISLAPCLAISGPQDLNDTLSSRGTDLLSVFANKYSMRLAVIVGVIHISQMSDELEVDRCCTDPTDTEGW